MKVTIHKQTLQSVLIGVAQTLTVPQGTTFLSVQAQGSQLTVWYQHKNPKKTITKSFIVAYTGQEFDLPAKYKFLGTVQISSLLFHVYHS